jgi:hypothetical protein
MGWGMVAGRPGEDEGYEGKGRLSSIGLGGRDRGMEGPKSHIVARRKKIKARNTR